MANGHILLKWSITVVFNTISSPISFDVMYHSSGSGIKRIHFDAIVTVYVSTGFTLLARIELINARIYFGNKGYDYPKYNYDLPEILRLAEQHHGLNRYLNKIRYGK